MLNKIHMPNNVVQRVSYKKAYTNILLSKVPTLLLNKGADDIVEKANTTVLLCTVVLVLV